MKEDFITSVEELQGEINKIKLKISNHRSSIDQVAGVVDKLELKLQKVRIASSELRDRLGKRIKKDYEDRIDLLISQNKSLSNSLEKLEITVLELNSENQNLNNRILQSTKIGGIIGGKDFIEIKGEEVNTVTSEIERKAKSVASTVSIIEKYIRMIYSGQDSFEVISKAVIVPNIYHKLIGEGCERYYIERMPDNDVMMMLIEEGEKFVSEIFDSAFGSLTNEEEWANSIDKIEKWWKLESLPILYGFVNKEEEDLFCEKPYSKQQILDWWDPNLRESVSATSSDAWNQFISLKESVNRENGVDDFSLFMSDFNKNTERSINY